MSFGISRLLEDLEKQGLKGAVAIKDGNGLDYAKILDYEIDAGTFAGKKVDLAIPAPTDYPRSYGSSIHLRSDPHLADIGSKIEGVRNVIASPIGDDWRYWSYSFILSAENPTTELLTQINGIFRKN